MAWKLTKGQQDAITVIGLGIAAIGLIWALLGNKDATTVGQSQPSYGGSVDPGSGVMGLPPLVTYQIGDNGEPWLPPPFDFGDLPSVIIPPRDTDNSWLDDALKNLSGGTPGCCAQAPATNYTVHVPPPQVVLPNFPSPVPVAQIPIIPQPAPVSYPTPNLLDEFNYQRALSGNPQSAARGKAALFGRGFSVPSIF